MKRLRIAALTLAAGLGSAGLSYAGNGTIVPGDPENMVPHAIQMSVFLGGPTSEEQLDVAKGQIEVANRILCDMTDSQFRIADVTFTTGEAMRGAADVWWLPTPTRATAGGLGNFGFNEPGATF